MKLFTHDVEIEVEDDTVLLGIAQTSSGSLLILGNDKKVYAVFSPVKSKIIHIHIPLEFIKIDGDVLELKTEATGNLERLGRVLADISSCLKNGSCYIDTVNNMLRSAMPVVSILNKRKNEECKNQYDNDICEVYRGAPLRLFDFIPFGSRTPLKLKE